MILLLLGLSVAVGLAAARVAKVLDDTWARENERFIRQLRASSGAPDDGR